MQSEIVEILRGLTSALSKHAQLEAPPQDIGAPPTAPLDATDSEAAADSYSKPLPERVALVRPQCL